MKRWDRLADEFMEVHSARGVSPGTAEAMRREWDRWGCWLKAKRPRPKLGAISHELITQYIAQRENFRAKSTLYGMISRMRQIGDFLVEKDIWRENPLSWMKGPRQDRRHCLPRRIDRSALAQIWESAATGRYHFHRYSWVAALGIFYGTGIRREELVLLDLSDWDAESGTLLISGKKTGQDLLEVARNHPVGELAPQVASLIEGVRIPIDHPPRRRTSQGTTPDCRR